MTKICVECEQPYGIRTLPSGELQSQGNYERSHYCTDVCMQKASNRKRTAYLAEQARLKEYYRVRLHDAEQRFIYGPPNI